MSQLLAGRNKGRFGAPPEAGPRSGMLRVLPLYFLVPITVLFLGLSVVTWASYYACAGGGSVECMSAGSVRPAVTGTVAGIVTLTGAMFVVALLLLLAATLGVRRWPAGVVYGLALLAPVLVVYAFLALNGSVPTPAGTLGDLPQFSSGDSSSPG